MKFMKKPVIIDAFLVSDLIQNFKHNFNGLPKCVKDAYENTTITAITDNDFIIKTLITAITDNDFIIKTLEGNMKATKEDYLIIGVQGEMYPCKIDIFNKTYERVEED